ncbi:hypothetical protein DERF_001987 [Dermatophagoides farinae]|uniref:Uncharacterized protein n=1 Tax=Dermatophagoides farinae TaxID=6954 RepID=A0A922LBL9_DERFA|nr:hypothetical protein DERF_001987 [Dermatophagoides farinae]
MGMNMRRRSIKTQERLVPKTKQATRIITVRTITEQVAGMTMVNDCIELSVFAPPPGSIEPEDADIELADFNVREIVSIGGIVSPFMVNVANM